jgi:cytoskeleton protein RodZ
MCTAAKYSKTGFDPKSSGVYREGKIFVGRLPAFRSPMGSFGEDLRKERVSRGIALEDISTVTKISQRHLLALEEEKFRLLPGGILSKGIVRGYAGALGLDQQDWTERFLKASSASGQTADDESGWTTFASNVGKARILRREAAQLRLRWIGAALLLLAVAVAAFFTIRYYGARENWWSSVIPGHRTSAAIHTAWSTLRALTTHLFSRV